MLLNRFLAFLNSSVKIRFTDADSCLISCDVKRNDISIIILVAVLLCKTSVYISNMTIVISIVSGFEGLNSACHSCILIIRARIHDKDNKKKQQTIYNLIHIKTGTCYRTAFDRFYCAPGLSNRQNHSLRLCPSERRSPTIRKTSSLIASGSSTARS